MTVDRTELRDWLEANCPAEMRQPTRGDEDICWGGRNWAFQSAAQKTWLERMASRGLTVPTWPKEYGGAGLSPEETAILYEEMHRIGARPPLVSFGIWMLGPALLKFGNRRAEAHSSALASRAAKSAGARAIPSRAPAPISPPCAPNAKDRGDHLLVNGQKIWTSYADKADWFFCLVRTDPAAKKQEGISFVLIDMASAGRLDQADRADLRQVAVLRDLLRQRRGPQGKPGRRSQSRLGRRQISADPRAQHDRRRRLQSLRQ